MEYYKIREARAELFPIIQGIELRIFQGEIALNLFEEIKNNFDSIVASGFGNLFFNLKLIAFNDMINCVCGLFDKYLEKYNYRVQSIPRTLHFIQLKKIELEIKNRALLLKKLKPFNIDTDTVQNLTDEELTKYIVEKVGEMTPKSLNQKKDDIIKFFNHKLNGALYNLQVLRNKKVAHYEEITINKSDDQTIAEAKSLIQFAKNFIDLIGNGYVDYDYSKNETYPRKKQAENFSNDLNKLLKKANII